jgi:hypothetical protein
MRGMRAGIWAIAVLAMGLTACTKEEAPTPPPAAPATEEKPMAPSGEMTAPGEMTPSGEATPSGENAGGESGG